MKKPLFLSVALWAGWAFSAAAELALDMTYLRAEVQRPPVLSNLDPVPEDLGIQGAHLAVQDSATTGKFLKHSYSLEVISVPVGGDVLAAARAALNARKLLLLDMPGAQMQQVADLPAAQDALLFNVSDPATDLRDAGCRANLLHTLPSQAMRADALMQFVTKKRWTKLAMIAGEHPLDTAFAAALERSAQKFGQKIMARKTWSFDADMRRNAAQEVPLFTQDFGDYDLLLVADELNDFGRYIPFNTWRPRPVAGSVSLVPMAWDRVVEQWGAVQMQNRFRDLAGRDMRPVDYAAWAAVRSVSEAATRINSNDPASLRAYILSEKFQLAGFKGRPLSYRGWNGQLRQTIPLVSGGAMVAQAPLEGFLHQRTELDTLGLDRPESTCKAFK
jgi:ABC transporter substrate binding protein (PQQ-dependent alcohol dehydrogenase system)